MGINRCVDELVQPLVVEGRKREKELNKYRVMFYLISSKEPEGGKLQKKKYDVGETLQNGGEAEGSYIRYP